MKKHVRILKFTFTTGLGCCCCRFTRLLPSKKSNQKYSSASVEINVEKVTEMHIFIKFSSFLLQDVPLKQLVSQLSTVRTT